MHMPSILPMPGLGCNPGLDSKARFPCWSAAMADFAIDGPREFLYGSAR
jgi:hypothetical protein